MHGFEKGIVYLIIGVAILFSSKWIYQNAVNPDGFKNKIIMASIAIVIVMFIILDFVDII